ncbi:hypothetical protein SAMN05443665_1001151 [Actinomadura meyerae]|uniref:Uncharacterized protein n=1 Tax=Actinomadura meyerae TaxID=240840 RepID=A0A239C249_9ACTN|nr:hypothetical protein [Actinomadura meyerae]SNS13484.1 hypothetical protein SAMN05443665_1001151 [Actinomadura meyerae]
MTTPTPVYAAAPHRPLHAGPVRQCPTCRTPLDGGPVRYRCEACGRSVMAADLDTEYHPADAPSGHPASDRGGVDSGPVRTAPDGRYTA